ncbi:MAG: sigma-70 family RNA polymerase sigma factor [Phycisphaerales bacterium]|nr:MAG: sigma-70 family RNA polymerase sigma factor [Phycisphaerales bacterium]
MNFDGPFSRPCRDDLENSERFGRLTVVVRKRLHPFILRAVGDPHAAEDLLQETLLVMVERLGGLRRAERFWPWIYRVARRKIQDHFQQQRRWATARENTRGETRRRFRAIYGRTDVLDQMIGVESVRELSDAMGEMEGRQRLIVRLRCFEQLPYAQIASRTRTSPAQARTNFYRAKTFLRKRLHARPA